MDAQTPELPRNSSPGPTGGKAWRRARGVPSLSESFASVTTVRKGPFWRKLLAFIGPGYLVAVGYMDPGNWATSLAGGSTFGYSLLSILLLSNLMAMLLQAASVRLGVASGLDLAQACRRHFSPGVNWGLWATCEVAIVACNLA